MTTLAPALFSQSKTAGWYKAATLAERQAAAPGSQPPDYELARQRLQRWKSQAPFTNEALFQERLQTAGLSEESLLELLGESSESQAARFTTAPAWLESLQTAFTENNVDPDLAHWPLAPDLALADFIVVIEPLLAQARARLSQGISQLLETRPAPACPFDPATIENLLLDGVAATLLEMLGPTIVLEMHIAGITGQLAGSTSQERYTSFVASLGQPPAALRFLQEYPVLARRLHVKLEQAVNFGLEFLQHLCQDWTELISLFRPQAEAGQLIGLEGRKGDQHRGGRAVLIAKFSTGWQLVYKPRSLAVDVRFQELLEWCNGQGVEPAFPVLKILARPDYGWVEFAEAAPCPDRAAVERFYARQGGYLALLYLLRATDFHYENVIAAGEYPLLIDLEALFHPSLSKVTQTAAERAMESSVLNTCFLPQRIWSLNDARGVELSGLGGGGDQISYFKGFGWENAGTDQLRRVPRQMKLAAARNQPTLNGQPVRLTDYEQSLIGGFSRVYQLLIDRREILAAPDGPLAAFKDVAVRVLLRDTEKYRLLLQHSYQPERLGDGLELEKFFDKLWLSVPRYPHLRRLIAAERYDLYQGDVPLFTTQPGSCHIWSSNGQLIPEFLSRSSLELVMERLNGLGTADLRRQLWIIRASLATVAETGQTETEQVRPARLPFQKSPRLDSAALSQTALANARRIGDRMAEIALGNEQGANWLGLNFERNGCWALSGLGLDLYEGLPGLALFLGYLGEVSGEQSYTRLARAALISVFSEIERQQATLKHVGSMAGWGGVIYSLAHLGALWQEEGWLEQAERLVELLPPLIEQDRFLDVISGTSGCLLGLISLYAVRPTPRIREVMVMAGEKLLTLAQPQPVGLAWPTEIVESSQPLVGFGRGGSGIGYSLFQLAAITGETRFAEAARAALDYERSVFAPAESNWPDFRTGGKAPLAPGELRFMTAWCHGAPGIGLSRLFLPAQFSDTEVKSEVAAAIQNTLAKGFDLNHSLCHGEMGNLELIWEAVQRSEYSQWQAEFERQAALTLAGLEQGWRCATPYEIETPGLMSGLAGIGYALLRLARPDRLPCLLVLEPPRQTNE